MGKTITKPVITYSITKDGCSPLDQNAIFVHHLDYNPHQGVKSGAKTLTECFLSTCNNYPDLPFLGTRCVNERGALGRFIWKTYSQVRIIAERICQGLEKMNLESNIGKIIGVFSKNREEWITIEMACLIQNIILVAIPDIINPEELVYIIKQCWLSTICCSKSQLDQIMRAKDSLPSLKNIISFEKVRVDVKHSALSSGIMIIEYDELLENSPQSNYNFPEPSSIFTISYTSGTTGNPKGVVLTHNSMISVIFASELDERAVYTKDSYLMYLPHSHIYDRIFFYLMLNGGGKVGLYSGDYNNIKSDLEALRPTIFVSVPRLFNKFYEVINQKFDEVKGLNKKLLNNALKKKVNKYEQTGDLSNGFLQSLIFGKAMNFLGGNVRLMVCGSAPISGEVIKFLRIVFSCPILEGYGLTECCGAAFLTHPQDTTVEHIGGPIPGIEAKILELSELGYRKNEHYITGELLIRGPPVFQGYYENESSQALDSDGWLHTGDIVQRFVHNGSFKIIGRLKDIVKLSQGEFVSLEKIENILLTSKLISQIFVFGDPFESDLVAVVVPSQDYITSKWVSGKKTTQPWEKVCNSKKLKRDILADFYEISSRMMLEKHEEVRNIYIEKSLWTDEDLLTGTQKLIRYKANSHYKAVIQQLYSELYNFNSS